MQNYIGLIQGNKIQVEAIAKVPGIDVLFVGPWDLGNNIGRPVIGAFHDDLSAAIERIRKAAAGNGKRSGIYCISAQSAKKYAEQGFHMVRPIFTVVKPRSDNSPLIKTPQDLGGTRCCGSSDIPLRLTENCSRDRDVWHPHANIVELIWIPRALSWPGGGF